MRVAFRQIVAELQACATQIGETEWRRRVRQAVDRLKIAKYRSDALPIHSAEIYEAILGFTNNSHAYLQSGRRPIGARHMAQASEGLRRLGFDAGLYDAERPATWAVFAQRAAALVAAATAQSGPTNLLDVALPYPAWRIVGRPDDVNGIIEALKRERAIAIVGTSGTGKSILARQVADAACTPDMRALPLHDARRRLLPALDGLRRGAFVSRDTVSRLYLGLWGEVLAQVARHVGLPSTDRSRLAFSRSLDPLWRAADSGLPRDPESYEARFLAEAFADGGRPNARDFIAAVGAHASGFVDETFVRQVADVLWPLASNALIIVDDVWRLSDCSDLVAYLFSAERGSGPALLVTAQEHASLPFHGPRAEWRIDAPTTGMDDRTRRFGLALVAAWGAPGHGPRTLHEAKTAILEFQTAHLRPESSAGIDALRVIERVQGHPLALATLAAVWRDRQWAPNFWGKAILGLDRADERLLRMPATELEGGIVAARHAAIVEALRYAWTLLDDDARDRYLDLTLCPPDEPVRRTLFHAYWKNLPGREGAFDPARDDCPLEMFCDLSLLHPLSDGLYRLHDLHRIMIAQELARLDA